MDYCILSFLYLLRRNALKLAIMPNECVINSVFVFAQNDLTNKSLQIWLRRFFPPFTLYIIHVFVLNRCPAVCADKSGGSSSGYL